MANVRGPLQFHLENLDISGFSTENCTLMMFRELFDNAVDAANSRLKVVVADSLTADDPDIKQQPTPASDRLLRPKVAVALQSIQVKQAQAQIDDDLHASVDHVMMTIVNTGSSVDPGSIAKLLGTLHCTSKQQDTPNSSLQVAEGNPPRASNSSTEGTAVGKYGLGAKLTAIASASYSGWFYEDLVQALQATLSSVPEAVAASPGPAPSGDELKNGLVSTAAQYSQLQSMPGALHICTISKQPHHHATGPTKQLSMLSLSPRRAADPAGPGPHLTPVLEMFKTTLSEAYDGDDCVAVRCVVPGSLALLVPKVSQYLQTFSFFPASALHHTLPASLRTSSSSVSSSVLAAVCQRQVSIQVLFGSQLAPLSSHALAFGSQPAERGAAAADSPDRDWLPQRLPPFISPGPLFDSDQQLAMSLEHALRSSKPVAAQHSTAIERSLGARLIMGKVLGAYDSQAHSSVAFSMTGTTQASGLRTACWVAMNTNAAAPGDASAAEGEAVDTAEVWLYRFANDAPLIADAMHCAATKAVAGVDWSEFGLVLSDVREPTDEEKLLAAAAHEGAVPSVVATLANAGSSVANGLLFHRLTLLTNVFRENTQDPIEFNGLSKNSLSSSKNLDCIVASLQLALRRLQLKQPLLLEDAAATSMRFRLTKIMPNIIDSVGSILRRAAPDTQAAARALFPSAGEGHDALLQEIQTQLHDAIRCNRFAELQVAAESESAT